MQLVITETDYQETFGEEQTKRIKQTQKEAILGDEDVNRHAVLDAFPKVLVERIKKMIPSDFEVSEIQIKLNVAGQPFGIGISSDATVKFGPKASRKI